MKLGTAERSVLLCRDLVVLLHCRTLEHTKEGSLSIAEAIQHLYSKYRGEN